MGEWNIINTIGRGIIFGWELINWANVVGF